MSDHDTDRTPDVTVYYDGACPLCRAEIAHYRGCRGADDVAFVDVSAPDADPGPDLPREAALARFHVRDRNGALHSGAAGFARLWRTLPGWRLAARVAAAPGVRTLLELAYRGFLPIRPALARLVGRFGGGARRG